MDRALTIGIAVAYVLMCFVYIGHVQTYVGLHFYNNGEVRNNTCDGCSTFGYLSSIQEETSICKVLSIEHCPQGVYLTYVGTFKCGDEAEYKSLADQSKIGQPSEHCPFDNEANIYQLVELLAVGLGLLIVPFLAMKAYYTTKTQ
jgi:hypothetical protein